MLAGGCGGGGADKRCTASVELGLISGGLNCPCAGHNGRTSYRRCRLTTSIRLDGLVWQVELRTWIVKPPNTMISNQGIVGGGPASSADKLEGAPKLRLAVDASVPAASASWLFRAEEVDTDIVARAVIRVVKEEDGPIVCCRGDCGGERCTGSVELGLILGGNCPCAGHNGPTTYRRCRLTTSIRLDGQVWQVELRI